MKTIPPPCPEPEVGPKYWRSLDQLADQPEFRHWLEREFPAGADRAPEGETRRDWIKLMSASFLLAGLGGFATGCRRPEEKLTPFAKQPEGYIHGKPQHFATAMPYRGTAVPLVVKAYEGRPVKLEGNPLHPGSNGGTDPFAQAALLNLYDPDRAYRHTQAGGDVKIEVVRDVLAAASKKFSANGGEGLAFLAERSSSPTRIRLQGEVAKKFPKAKWFVYEPVDFTASHQAVSAVFGAEAQLHLQLESAQRILSLDADFIGSDQEAYSQIRGYAKGRRSADDQMSRLYAVESLMTLTGGNADHRMRVRPTDVVKVAAQIGGAVLAKLEISGELAVTLKALAAGSPAKAEWVEACAADLAAHKGAAVVLAGYTQPPAVHLIAQALNAALGAFGKTVHALKPTEAKADGSIVEAVAALKAGLDTLVILGGNPAYNAPADLDFAAALKNAKTVIRHGYYEDETSLLAQVNIAATHFLESWGDARTADGTLVPVQPLIEPLFGGVTEIEVIARVLGLDKVAPLDLVRATFAGDDAAWRKFLHDGFLVDGTVTALDAASADPAKVVALLAAEKPVAGKDYDVVLVRDASVDDGRFNNNGWLQEAPDPITKVTWENVILVSPKTARDLGVAQPAGPKSSSKPNAADAADGQYRQPLVTVKLGDRTVQGPVWVQPGLADNTIGLALGYGRTQTGRVGRGSGYNAYALYLAGSRHQATGATITVGRGRQLVAVTQEHGLMEGRPIIREANVEQFKAKPDFAKHMDLDAHLPHFVPFKAEGDGRNVDKRPQNIYEHPYDQNPGTASKIHQWGMVLDLTTCVGCNACVLACQSENNIPIVGKDQVARGREMAWMRIDRYYSHDPAVDVTSESAAEDPQMAVQPMFCQHCEAAPCESVCPVNATVHDEEGLNVMAYNRCIGTRYCANNCPYKVRRFNFFDYNKRETDYASGQSQHFFNFGNLYKGPAGINRNEAPEWEIIKLVKNPDVSVRMRGVMEKCTFCVQRIEQAKIARKVQVGNSGEVAVPDGTFKTACQQVCPAEAITFGNVLDADSAVSKLKRNPRNYSVLGFLDTRPRVTYLARIRNPNPEIAKLEGRTQPDTLRDYERFRHESPFETHGSGATPAAEKHAAAGLPKGGA
jgi:MoCo/4Fe-4S cofactor protein with predicted Tat translocation signal